MNPISIYISPTPNPNALKFVLDRAVKEQGNSTYKIPSECPEENHLAKKLFELRGVDQVHFFQNSITITKFNYEDWEELEPKISQAIQDNIHQHNPSYYEPDPEAERRAGLNPEMQQIEDILDRTIRPGLQGDGGDLRVVSYEENVLLIKFQGACGTCPSSTAGTLEAIKGILREQFNPDLDVFVAPEF